MGLFVVILTTTYTANLASFFTKQGVKYSGPTDMNSFASSSFCTGEPSTVNDIGRFTSSTSNVAARTLPADGSCGSLIYRDQAACCMKKVADGTVGSWVDLTPTLTSYVLQDKCVNYYVVPEIEIKPFEMSFGLLASTHKNLTYNINTALAFWKGTPHYSNLLQTEMNVGKKCPTRDYSDLEKLDLEPMMGLFLVCFSMLALSVIIAIAEHCARKDINRQISAKDEQEMKEIPGSKEAQLGLSASHQVGILAEVEAIKSAVESLEARMRDGAMDGVAFPEGISVSLQQPFPKVSMWSPKPTGQVEGRGPSGPDASLGGEPAQSTPSYNYGGRLCGDAYALH